MRELHVSTHTTPDELADFFNQLRPDDQVGGRSGDEGAVVLYVPADTPSAPLYSSRRDAIAARVAIEVVLQHVAGMPGAQSLLLTMREQFAGELAPKAGWLAPPLTVLARLYRKTVNAMSTAVDRTMGLHTYASHFEAREEAEQPGLTCGQQQALEQLLDRLALLPGPVRLPGRR